MNCNAAQSSGGISKLDGNFAVHVEQAEPGMQCLLAAGALLLTKSPVECFCLLKCTPVRHKGLTLCVLQLAFLGIAGSLTGTLPASFSNLTQARTLGATFPALILEGRVCFHIAGGMWMSVWLLLIQAAINRLLHA